MAWSLGTFCGLYAGLTKSAGGFGGGFMRGAQHIGRWAGAPNHTAVRPATSLGAGARPLPNPATRAAAGGTFKGVLGNALGRAPSGQEAGSGLIGQLSSAIGHHPGMGGIGGIVGASIPGAAAGAAGVAGGLLRMNMPQAGPWPISAGQMLGGAVGAAKPFMDAMTPSKQKVQPTGNPMQSLQNVGSVLGNALKPIGQQILKPTQGP